MKLESRPAVRYWVGMSPLARRVTVALLLAAAGPALGATKSGRVEDDYPRALSDAKRRGVPVVVDVWAPW